MSATRSRRSTAKSVNYAKEQEFSDADFLDSSEEEIVEKKRSRPKKRKESVQTQNADADDMFDNRPVFFNITDNDIDRVHFEGMLPVTMTTGPGAELFNTAEFFAGRQNSTSAVLRAFTACCHDTECLDPTAFDNFIKTESSWEIVAQNAVCVCSFKPGGVLILLKLMRSYCLLLSEFLTVSAVAVFRRGRYSSHG